MGYYSNYNTNSHELTQMELYEKLRRLYINNGYYSYRPIYNSTKPYYEYVAKVKPIRTVVNRSVEFYVSKICPTIEVVSKNERIIEAADNIFKWSNFAGNKSAALRDDVLYGNLFWKVVCDGEKVYFTKIDTPHVTELELDVRGYITEIRIDIPIVSDLGVNLTYTEFWNKEYYAIWEHNLGIDADLENLGTPKETGWLIELGIDFIPIVQVKFKDVGEEFGFGSVNHCLDKIDEANKEASRLSDLLFRYNKNTMVVSANDVDKSGRPMPSPKIDTDTDVYEEDKDSILYLKGMAKISSLIPDINYNAALAVLNAMMDELREDLPELKYYNQDKSGTAAQKSGEAIKLTLAGAIDRVIEAQSNFTQALVRVIEIGITLGNYWNVFSIPGKYEDGDFTFDITAGEVFAKSEKEKAELLGLLTKLDIGIEVAMKMAGYTIDEIAEVLISMAAEEVVEEEEPTPADKEAEEETEENEQI